MDLLSGTTVNLSVVSIVGGGIVGQNAAEMANAIGANMRIFDTNDNVVEYLSEKYVKTNITVEKASYSNLLEACYISDVLIATVLVPGSITHKIISKEMVMAMQKGRIIVDVSSDQEGSVETAKTRTIHNKPIYN